MVGSRWDNFDLPPHATLQSWTLPRSRSRCAGPSAPLRQRRQLDRLASPRNRPPSTHASTKSSPSRGTRRFRRRSRRSPRGPANRFAAAPYLGSTDPLPSRKATTPPGQQPNRRGARRPTRLHLTVTASKTRRPFFLLTLNTSSFLFFPHGTFTRSAWGKPR